MGFSFSSTSLAQRLDLGLRAPSAGTGPRSGWRSGRPSPRSTCAGSGPRRRCRSRRDGRSAGRGLGGWRSGWAGGGVAGCGGGGTRAWAAGWSATGPRAGPGAAAGLGRAAGVSRVGGLGAGVSRGAGAGFSATLLALFGRGLLRPGLPLVAPGDHLGGLVPGVLGLVVKDGQALVAHESSSISGSAVRRTPPVSPMGKAFPIATRPTRREPEKSRTHGAASAGATGCAGADVTVVTSRTQTPRKALIWSRCLARSSSLRTPRPSSGARQSTPTLPWWALRCTSSAAWPTSSRE